MALALSSSTSNPWSAGCFYRKGDCVTIGANKRASWVSIKVGNMVRERRGNIRIESNLDVALYYNSLVLLSCRARDISLGGVFVDTGGQLLPQSTKIDVRFDASVDGQYRYHQLQAEVMHIKDQGVGLKFEHADFPSIASVVSMVAVS